MVVIQSMILMNDNNSILRPDSLHPTRLNSMLNIISHALIQSTHQYEKIVTNEENRWPQYINL